MKQIIKSSPHPSAPANPSLGRTCVFLLSFMEKDEPMILAILKADNEGYPWRNQVALPGGHIDPDDPNAKSAAFRELEEELNILPDSVDFIGSIGHFMTINNKTIEAFLGVWNNNSRIKFDENEIAKVLEIPVRQLVRTHDEKQFNDRHPDIGELIYPFEDVEIWGVTARIIHHFIETFSPCSN